MKGLPVIADTWEAANTEAGQRISKAYGKISVEKGQKMLKKAKNDNWKSLLKKRKLNILAAIRNIRNIAQVGDEETLSLLCDLVSNGKKIRQGKVMPYQLELAMTSIVESSLSTEIRKLLLNSLEVGMERALPNLKEKLSGKSLVMLDISGSMSNPIHIPGTSITCLDKASVLAAMLAKSVNADVILFDNAAEYALFNQNDSIRTLSRTFNRSTSKSTNISSAFNLITEQKKAYDRIFLLSDNEANEGCVRSSYNDYVKKVADPYVYCIDLQLYGTAPMPYRNKVYYFYGYGYSMLEDLSCIEFNPQHHIKKIMDIKI